ncbi:MAG: ORF6N domain-containing protein [Candidatus Omnitrophica bacterium]|nr:ORF6N domain-containing protein [Candidatus Omnitrophota bacterium]
MRKRIKTVGFAEIEDSILVLREQKVMLDRTLAQLYGVETRVLNQAVRRNIKRFPPDFMFSLTRTEIMNLSQVVISSGIKHAPHVFVFTQEGIAMLSGILNSSRAVQVNIAIMRAFVKFRQILSGNKELALKLRELEQRVGGHDEAIHDIIVAIRDMMNPPVPKKPKGPIGFCP